MPQVPPPGFRFGDFSLIAAERRLLCRGESVPLTPKVFDTLLLLVENAGHLVEKEAFLRQLWPDAFVEESSLAQNISILRKVLGDTRLFLSLRINDSCMCDVDGCVRCR